MASNVKTQRRAPERHDVSKNDVNDKHAKTTHQKQLVGDTKEKQTGIANTETRMRHGTNKLETQTKAVSEEKKQNSQDKQKSTVPPSHIRKSLDASESRGIDVRHSENNSGGAELKHRQHTKSHPESNQRLSDNTGPSDHVTGTRDISPRGKGRRASSNDVVTPHEWHALKHEVKESSKHVHGIENKEHGIRNPQVKSSQKKTFPQRHNNKTNVHNTAEFKSGSDASRSTMHQHYDTNTKSLEHHHEFQHASHHGNHSHGNLRTSQSHKHEVLGREIRVEDWATPRWEPRSLPSRSMLPHYFTDLSVSEDLALSRDSGFARETYDSSLLHGRNTSQDESFFGGLHNSLFSDDFGRSRVNENSLLNSDLGITRGHLINTESRDSFLTQGIGMQRDSRLTNGLGLTEDTGLTLSSHHGNDSLFHAHDFRPKSITNTSQKAPYSVKTCNMHVEHGAERKESWITGFAILSRDLVIVADYNNNRVKIINVEESYVLSRIVMQTAPKDLAVVSPDLVAVTLPALDTVQYLSINGRPPTLDISKQAFKVNGYCNGIEYNEDRLFVTFTSPPKVEILTLQGECIHTLSEDQYGSPLFKSPQYLAVMYDMIFVTDSQTNSVVRVSRNGHEVATYQDEALGNPQGIAITDDGQILVCGQDLHNIHLITLECRKVSVCLDLSDGIWWPHVIGYCRDRNSLYISSTSGEPEVDNYLRMYTFEEKIPLSLRLMKLA